MKVPLMKYCRPGQGLAFFSQHLAGYQFLTGVGVGVAAVRRPVGYRKRSGGSQGW